MIIPDDRDSAGHRSNWRLHGRALQEISGQLKDTQ